jgi:iron(III) transport system substrate-binding protein
MKKFRSVTTWLLPVIGLAVAAGLSANTAQAQLVIDGETIADAALLSAAQKEGKLNVYGTWPPRNQKILNKAFKKDTGIDISFVRATSRKMFPRILAEHSAGRLGADFVDLTDLTFIVQLVQKGVLTVPYKVRNWDKIQSTLKDSQGRWYTFMRLTQVIGVNTAIVKPAEEPKGYADLLDPKWKGRIGLPTIDAGGSAFAVQAFLKEVVQKDYWKRLAALSPRVFPSVSPTVTDMVRGEVHVALAGSSTIINQIKSGAPAKVIFPKEGIPAFPLSGGITSSAKNLNAAKLYLNYITSKRGGTVYASTGNYGTHPDAPVPNLMGLKYPPQDQLWTVPADHWKKVRQSYSEEWRATFGRK